MRGLTGAVSRVLATAAVTTAALLSTGGGPAQAATPRPDPLLSVSVGPVPARPKPGGTVALPFTLFAAPAGNKGVVISFSGSRNLGTRERDRASNCFYGREEFGPRVYCVLDATTLEPGKAYAPDSPPRFRLTERALNERVEVRADPMSRLDYARGRVGDDAQRGHGPPLRLVPTDRPAGGASPTRITATADLLADSSTDDRILMPERTFTGTVGDTVLLRPEWHRAGPGFYNPGSEAANEPFAEVEYVIPRGLSPVDRRDLEHCRALDSAEGHRYRCLMANPLELRLDEPLEGARGSVSVVPGPKEDGLVHDRDRANDSVAFTVTAAPDPDAVARAADGWAIGGAALVSAAVVLVGGALVLRVRRRGRPATTVWLLVGALICAAAGTTALLVPAHPDPVASRGFPAARYKLNALNLWDDARIFEPVRPAGVPRVTTSRDDAYERGMTEMHAYFSAEAAGGGVPVDQWIAVDGAYGSIRDPDRSRTRMLAEAARADGVTLTSPARESIVKDENGHKLKIACQRVTIAGEGFDMCAWADGNTRAVVTTAASGGQGGPDNTVSVRDEMRW